MGKKKDLKQYAALAWRLEEGQPLVLLVTSRETRRWILPKGRPEQGRAPHWVAAREAFEEAGVKGDVQKKAFAAFASVKRLKNGTEMPARVFVYLLQVDAELDDWPEKGQRERRWVSPGEAALLVTESGLVKALLHFGARFG